jgi:hypothetical protein
MAGGRTAASECPILPSDKQLDTMNESFACIQPQFQGVQTQTPRQPGLLPTKYIAAQMVFSDSGIPGLLEHIDKNSLTRTVGFKQRIETSHDTPAGTPSLQSIEVGHIHSCHLGNIQSHIILLDPNIRICEQFL